MGLNWRPEAQQAGNGRVPRGLKYMAAWAYLVSTSELRGRRSFVHRLRLDLKTPIKKVPWRFAKGGGGETRNTRNRRQKAAAGEDRRGETLPESPPEGSTPLRRVHHQHLQQDHLHLPTVNSWQTWCMMQYTIPLIYCVSHLCLRSDLFMALVK
jgi:hypothetical protein